MSGWTQPCCDGCWADLHGTFDAEGHLLEIRVPHRIVDPEWTRCCHCGRATQSGIFIRVNPLTVPYPLER